MCVHGVISLECSENHACTVQIFAQVDFAQALRVKHVGVVIVVVVTVVGATVLWSSISLVDGILVGERDFSDLCLWVL